MTKQLRLKKNVTDESGDTDLFIAAGTVVNFLSDELLGEDDHYIIAETLDGKVSFPLDPDEFEEVEQPAETPIDLCAVSKMPYDDCDQLHEGECVWQCGACNGNTYNCQCGA